MTTRFMRRTAASILLLVASGLLAAGCTASTTEPQSFTGQEPVKVKKPYYESHSKGSQWGRIVYR